MFKAKLRDSKVNVSGRITDVFSGLGSVSSFPTLFSGTQVFLTVIHKSFPLGYQFFKSCNFLIKKRVVCV